MMRLLPPRRQRKNTVTSEAIVGILPLLRSGGVLGLPQLMQGGVLPFLLPANISSRQPIAQQRRANSPQSDVRPVPASRRKQHKTG